MTIADNDGPAATNHPPEVKIALPSDGATFIAPANILLSALPDDVDGFVATVEFFEGTHSLGVTTNNPEIVGPETASVRLASGRLLVIETARTEVQS